MSISRGDGIEQTPMEIEMSSEASYSNENDEQGHGLVLQLNRDFFGTGWDNVKKITQSVIDKVYDLAAQSGEPDKFLEVMEGVVRLLVQTPELRATSLCCSLVLHCAEEFERTQRPRMALHLYKMAREISATDVRMMDLAERADSGCEKLVAAGTQREIDAGFPTWDTLPEKFIRGPVYRSIRDDRTNEQMNRYIMFWEFEMKEGRENIAEINFSFCDYMRILSGGDRQKCLEGIMDEFTNYMEETPCMKGTPLHCSFLFLCAHEFETMGKLEEAVKLYSKVQKFTAEDADPEMRRLEKRTCRILTTISRNANPYLGRFLELVDEADLQDDFCDLHALGVTLLDTGKYEEAITALTKCLMMMSAAPLQWDDASILLLALSSSYEHLNEHHAAFILLEQARLRAESESCQCNQPCVGCNRRDHHLKRCVVHCVLPRIFAQQGRLQSRYGSRAEASKSFEKGLEWATNDHELVSVLEHHLFEDILVAHNNMNLHMSGNFTLSSVDLYNKTLTFFQKLQVINSNRPENDPFSEERKDYSNRIKFWLDLHEVGLGERAPKPIQALELNMKALAMAQEKGKGPWDLCIAHLAVLEDLQALNRSSDLEAVEHHFNEAVNCGAAFSGRTDMDALNMRLALGWHALRPKIMALDAARTLFAGIIQVLERKLDQLATLSDEHALRFLEMTKHAYMYMTLTYIKFATRSLFVVNEDGMEVLAHPQAADSTSGHRFIPDDPESLRRALLWSERSKGRLLMKRLEQPLLSVTTSDFEILNPNSSPAWEMTTLERKFHTDDDWAMDFIFLGGGRFSHHGSKMVFVEFTMVSRFELATFIMNDQTGTIEGFRRSNLSLTMDDEARKLAEEEMELLTKNLHLYQKLDESAVSQSKFLAPALYAMNEPESRMLYFNRWIPGLVARFQRLAFEAQKLRENKRRRCPGGASFQGQMDSLLAQIDYLLRTLYRLLIGPLEETFRRLFEQCADYTLVFVPHEDLSVLPFPALRDENGKYLIEKYPVSVSPSIWVARHCQHLYDHQLQSTPGPELLVGRATGYPKSWPDLPEAHNEIASIKEFCGRGATEVVDCGDDGALMKERVMEHVQTASWVHFAVHGDISRAFPRGSLLLGDTDMARWNSDEITAAGLPCARSVVLSACQSGLGILGGEGVLGFARAFVRAGVPSCVLTLWEVHEGFCLKFMKQLYKHLHGGEDLAHAMQKSTVYMMQEREAPRHRAHRFPPFKWLVLDWAAFSCIGYASVKLPSQSRIESSSTSSSQYASRNEPR